MYQLTEGNTVIRLSDNASIPNDPENMDYQEYQQWVSDGGVPLPTAEPPPPTAADILVSQSFKLQGMVQLAASQKNALSNRIADIEFSVDDGTAAPGEDAELATRKAQLVLWFRYSSSLGRVTSQVGWPSTVNWPVQPATGMDLTVSASTPESA